ncbi:MAG: type II toxin-antitoxin system PemK/MazF family toxin [Solirubrobacterales bacterium]
MKRGEVWWHEPPDEKGRPVLILTRDDVGARVLDVAAMPVSRTAHDWLTEVEIGPEDGMPTISFLIAENTLSAEKIYLTQRITELGAAKMNAVCRALATATSCG